MRTIILAAGRGMRPQQAGNASRRCARLTDLKALAALCRIRDLRLLLVRRDRLTNASSRTYYLDLGRLAGLQDQRNTPFTPALHAYYALVEGLRALEDQGDRGRPGTHYGGLAYARLHDELKAEWM